MERLICQTLRCKGNRSRQVSIQHNRAWDIQPAVPAFQATGSSKPRRRQSGLQSSGAPAEPSGRRRWRAVLRHPPHAHRAFARDRSISFCRLRTFFRSPSCVAVKIRCRSRRTSSSTARQSTASQSRTSPSGPFTVDGVQLAHRFRHLHSLLLTGSPDPRQLPFGPGTRPYPTSYAAPSGGGAGSRGSRFPVAFRLSAFASWVILRPLGSSPSSRSAYRRSTAGPQRGCHVAHEQDSTGQGAPFTPGTVVRSRPATILRPAPAAFQRPVPTAPLTHPIGGGHLHEASSGVHSRSPITPRWLAATPEPGSDTASRRSSPRPRPPDGTAAASASTPGFAPRGHPRRTPGRRQAIAHWPGYYTFDISRTSTVPPTSLMHPHVAPTRTSLPAPPPGTAPACSAQPTRPDR